MMWHRDTSSCHMVGSKKIFEFVSEEILNATTKHVHDKWIKKFVLVLVLPD